MTDESAEDGVKAFLREHLDAAYPKSFTLRELALAYVEQHATGGGRHRDEEGVAATILSVSEGLSELVEEGVVSRLDGDAVAGDDARYRLRVWR